MRNTTKANSHVSAEAQTFFELKLQESTLFLFYVQWCTEKVFSDLTFLRHFVILDERAF